MKTSHFLLLLLTTICFNLHSQTDTVQKGYFYGRGSVGILIGNLSSGSAQLSSGYRFRCGLETGIGLGYETHYDRYAPVFAEMRYHFGKKRTQPFVGILGGALFELNNYYGSNDPKATFGAQIGLTHFFSKHVGLSTSVGYRYTTVDYYYYFLHSYFAPEYYSASPHRVEVRIGLVLK